MIFGVPVSEFAEPCSPRASAPANFSFTLPRLDPEKRRLVRRGELELHLAVAVDGGICGNKRHIAEVDQIRALFRLHRQLELTGR